MADPNGQATPADRAFSVVVTVRDDRDELGLLLEALARQSQPPVEAVIVDGGSTDGTSELAARWRPDTFPVRLIDAPGANISAGRNIGIEAAKHGLGGLHGRRLPPGRGLARGVRGAARRMPTCSPGSTSSPERTTFERALAVALYPQPVEIGDESPFVARAGSASSASDTRRTAPPRARSPSRRDAWRAAGGFPEHVYAGEDPAFSQAVVASGMRVELVPDAAVLWRPRPTWRGNARMYHSYARGSLATGAYFRHLVRAVVWGAAPILATRGGRPGRLALLAWWAAYLSLPVRRAQRSGMPPSTWWLLPLVIAMKDLSQIAGAAAAVADLTRGTEHSQSSAKERPSPPPA